MAFEKVIGKVAWLRMKKVIKTMVSLSVSGKGTTMVVESLEY